MEKILLLRGLGTGGRQNELIELAITYHFQSVEIDMTDLLGRHETLGKDFALQFLTSAKITVGTFRLPIDFGGDDESYAKQVAKLETMIELATALECPRCYIEVESGSDVRAFQENFEKQTGRIKEISKRLEAANMRIGLKMEPLAARKPRSFKFIETSEQLLTMIRMCSTKNVGLCLDTGEWPLNSGALDQISDLAVEKIVEVRFSESEPGAGKTAIFHLPEQREGSLVEPVALHLKTGGYKGAIAITGHASMFSRRDRDSVIRGMDRALTQISELIKGKREELSLAPQVAEPEVAEEGAEGAEAEAPAVIAAV